jgi:hypothetical protein
LYSREEATAEKKRSLFLKNEMIYIIGKRKEKNTTTTTTTTTTLIPCS